MPSHLNIHIVQLVVLCCGSSTLSYTIKPQSFIQKRIHLSFDDFFNQRLQRCRPSQQAKSLHTLHSSSSAVQCSSTSSGTPKRSRSERKALEREKKQQRNQSFSSSSSLLVDNRVYHKNATSGHHRKYNVQQREKMSLAPNDKKTQIQSITRNSTHFYPLHSKHISMLTANSTANEVLVAIKRAQNTHNLHDIRSIGRFLLEEVDESFAFGYRGSILARFIVAALHLNQHAVARQALETRTSYHSNTILPMESAAIIRGLLRVHNVSDAFAILQDELSLPSDTSSMEGSFLLNTTENREKIKQRALSLASFISRHFFEGEPCMAVQACNQLIDMGSFVKRSGLSAIDVGIPWTRLIKGAAQCEAGRRNGTIIPCLPHVRLPSNLGYVILRAMMTFPPDNTDEVYEALSNTLVRRSVFVTGAVSIEGCPPPDRGEIVFIGRSNVGKSSLVNMVTNRKSLAYTSKRPGKTQQFNFFAINDKPGKDKEVKFGDAIAGEKDRDSFYLVDVPGFGFAKVPEAQRKKWMEFLSVYISQRKSLRLIFHLIDCRVGPTDDDAKIMDQIRGTKVTYVIALTKADKVSKEPTTSTDIKIADSHTNASGIHKILKQLRATMIQHGVGDAPVLFTSSETKLGRDALWSYMQLAVDEIQ